MDETWSQGFACRGAAVVLLVACNFAPPVGTGGSTRHAEPSSGSVDAAATDAARDAKSDVVTGGTCTIATSGGTMLCETISACPGVTVGQNAFAGCGFRVAGHAIDLECECDGYLCPAGMTTTCAQVSTILARETAAEVCDQLSNGRCSIELPTGDAGGSSSGAGCDQACTSLCAGDPTCTRACGC